MSTLLALALAALLPAARQEDDAALPYRVPMDTEAAVRADNALRFVDEQSWTRAIEELQLLIDRHAQAVLPRRFAEERASMYGLHVGAGTWATAELAALPDAARARYRERFGEEARNALFAARERADSDALAAVGRRYPLTDAGAAAWLALGDLELARGDAGAAIEAWERSARRAEQAGLDAPEGLDARRAAAAELAPRAPAGLGLPGRAEHAGPAPLAGADRWTLSDLDLRPFDRVRGQEGYNLFPLLSGDKLLVSTSLRLYCIDSFSSKLLWSAGPPAGWEGLAASKASDILQRVDHGLALVAPAAGRGVAVAALQVPYADQQSHEYQGIDILGAFPERRLFAFDLATGRPLWDHAPPPGWDGETGPYEERMMVAAPPVIAGSRVIVPSYRMRGRIDYQVACYDLADGSLCWSTGLISGQGELNMFGRQEKEYSGAPVAVDGDGVYVVTHLGALARLDLYTGRIVWESRYEQIPIPKSPGWTDEDRDLVWRNAPAAVAGDVIVATPYDSYQILGLDKETGAVLWSYDFHDLPAAGQGSASYRVLLGAYDDTVYVAGHGPGGIVVTALQKPGGLHPRREGGSRAAFQARWSAALDMQQWDRTPRPVLGREEIVVYGHDERVVLDRRTGRRLEAKAASSAESERGNLLLSDGVLVSLGNRKLTAEFDWDVLLERADAALAADPEGAEPRIAHASLALRRARSLYDAGRVGAARPLLERARASLSEVLRRDGQARDPRVARTLYEVLREEARVAELEAEPDRALSALSDALALAASPEDVRDTLLAEEEIVRLRDPERWRATLARLEAEVPELPLPPRRLETDATWLTAESIYEILPADLRGVEIPVGLWVLLARAESAARAGERAQALEDLHAALARYGGRALPFGLTVADVASARIARRIELDGREPYAAFEERAAQLLERAVAAGDEALLIEVGRLYPHAQAAERADATRLAWALERGSADQAARLAFESVSASPELTAAGAETLARLGALFAARGNHELERTLVRRAARAFPDAPSPAHGGRPLAEVAAGLAAASEPPRAPATFGETLARAAPPEDGRFEVRGTLTLAGQAESPPERIDVLSDRRRLIGLSAEDPARPRWAHELADAPLDDALAVGGGVVVAAAGEEVVALEGGSGAIAWRAPLAPDSEAEAVVLHGGIALVLATRKDAATGDPLRSLSAFDVEGGVALWSVELSGRARWAPPRCDDGVAVLIEPMFSATADAAVVDLARGRIERTLDLGASVADEGGAWVEDKKLVVPFFRSSDTQESRVVAYDLETGREAFRIGFGQDRDIDAVAAWGGKSFLVLQAVPTAGQKKGGEVLELDVRLGRTRRIEALKPHEDTMGLPRRARTELAEPCLFTYTLAPKASAVPVRLIPLDDGPGWVYSLHVSEEALYDDGLPAPAVGDRLVAIAYSTRNRANLAREESRVELVDRRGGFHRKTITLSPQMSKARVGVHGLGSALLVLGTGRYGTRDISQMEVLETMR